MTVKFEGRWEGGAWAYIYCDKIAGAFQVQFLTALAIYRALHKYKDTIITLLVRI